MELLFPKRLRELRKEKGISQVEMGEHLGYGYTAISSYETGRTGKGVPQTFIGLKKAFPS